MFGAGSVKNYEKFFDVIETNINDKKVEGKIMTIAECLRKKGMKEGRRESLKFVALKMLKGGIPVEKIAKITGLR